MTADRNPAALLVEHFGSGANPAFVSVPGRANLIGEHIDYHNLPVLPIAIQRSIRIAFRARGDRRIRAVSEGPFAGARCWSMYSKHWRERESSGSWLWWATAAR